MRHARPLLLRIWHWLNALAVLGALGTVLLRKTFLSWRTNSQLIETRLTDLGVTISTKDAVALAKEIRAPMWEWHYTIGLTLAGLLVLRLIIAVIDPTQAPFRTTWRVLTGFSALPATAKRHHTHRLLVKLAYVLFYVMLVFMAVSGLSMYFGDTLGLSDALAGDIKEVHELAMWFFPGFVAVHITGVVVAELRGDRGLVSDMIHGGESDGIRSDAGG